MDNAYDYINLYRVQRLSGGAILYPFNDDDRYQFDFGGVFDKIADTTMYNKTAFSRFTWRPNKQLCIIMVMNWATVEIYMANHH